MAAACLVGTSQLQVTGMQLASYPCQGPNGTMQMCQGPQPKYEPVPVQRLSDAYGGDPAALLGLAESFLAPSGVEDLHEQFVRALRAEVNFSGVAADRPALLAVMQRACAAKASLEAEISARPPAETTDSYFLQFQPPVGPAIDLDTREGLSLTPTFQVSLGEFGDVTAGYRGPPGITELIVRYESKQRRFRFDRPFQFQLPDDYAYTVTYAGEDSLIISVAERGTR